MRNAPATRWSRRDVAPNRLLCLAPLLCFASALHAGVLTLPLDQRPDWLSRDGIVMAGSWEPLLFRVRRDGAEGYTATAEQRAAYVREHSPEMVAALKELGINFVMMHCHKGGGLEAERESMQDAVAFAKLCHDAGLRVGVYTYSGAFLWELLFKEVPEAKDWVVLGPDGKPRTYGRAIYRYYWNRNHPDAQAYYRRIVQFAVNEIKTDLLHFDNYSVGPGRDANSVQRFHQYLRDTFTPDRLEAIGIDDVESVEPPMTGPPDSLKSGVGNASLLRRAWLDFSCQSLADSYHDMGRYARTLRKDVLVECNPGGVGGPIRAPVDHGRLLQGGEAFWDESLRPGYRDGALRTRIRTFKVARRMDNIAFNYTTTPLEAAEAMAFNRDCLGCVCWFEYGNIVERPGFKNPVSSALKPYIRFFHARRDLLRDARVVADVAILRGFASQVFAGAQHAQLTYRVEQTFIEHNVPFQIIYDHHLSGVTHAALRNDLARYRALVLAGCVALSDRQAEQIRAYVKAGGRLCVVGPAGTHDAWMLPRDRPAVGGVGNALELDGLPEGTVVQVAADGDALAAVRRACGGALSLSVAADPPEPAPSPWAVGAAFQPYTDRDYAITRMPEELVGLRTIRFSHSRAKQDASLRFIARVPVRVFVVFGPESDSDQWLDLQPGWELYEAGAVETTMKYDLTDIYYRDFDAGPVTLFEGRKGNYILLGIKGQTADTTGPAFVLEQEAVGLCTEVTDQADRRLVHFVNYRDGGPFRNVQVRLGLPPERRPKGVTLVSPDRENDVALPFEREGDTVAFVVPEVKVYEIAVVSLE